jgi:hypothetical protein
MPHCARKEAAGARLFVHELRDVKFERATCYWAAPFRTRRGAGEWVERIVDA